MAIRYLRPRSVASVWSCRVAILALTLFGVGVVVHRSGALATPYFAALFAVAVVLSLIGLVLAAAGLFRLWHVGAKGGRAALLGIVCAVGVLAPAGHILWSYLTRPHLFEVTSNAGDVPAWIEAPRVEQMWLPRPAETSAAMRGRQLSAYPAVTGRRYEGALDRVLPAVEAAMAAVRLSVVAERGTDRILAPLVSIVGSEPDGEAAGDALPASVPLPIARPPRTTDVSEPGSDLPAGDDGLDVLFQAVHRSPVFGLSSDVVVRLTEEAETTFVDIRIAARFGSHDLGAGAALAEAFFDELDRTLIGIAGG